MTADPAPAALAPAPAPRAPSFRRALGNRPFFLLWASQLISQSGDFVFDVALLWLVWEATGSDLSVAVVVVAAIVPTVVLGPILGVYADRWPRRTILIGTNLAEAALIAAFSGLVLAHTAPLGLIIAVVFALGVGQQFVRVTSSAMVPQTVDTDDLATANSLMSFSSSTTQIAGLALGGLVVALFGVTLPIAYDALSFLVAAAILVLMSSAVGRPSPPDPGAAPGFAAQFAEGFRYVVGQRYLVEIVAIGVVINFAGNATFALWAPYAAVVLHGGPLTYGLLGAMIAVGSIVGAAAVGKLNVRPIAGRLIFAGLVAFGALVVALGLTHTVPFALAEAFGVGAFVSAINVPLLTAVQARVPARLMGRVMSVLLGLILAAAPFGAIVAGELAVATSIGLVYAAMGALALVTATIGFVAMRDVRDLTY